jgi:hypothetical protein
MKIWSSHNIGNRPRDGYIDIEVSYCGGFEPGDEFFYPFGALVKSV